MDQEQSFTADVKIAGINPYVDVPERIVNALGGGKKAAVLVKVAGIDEALVGSRALLVLLTENSFASKWVEEEWRKYYRLIVESAEARRLLSLRLGGPPISELPLTLTMYQIIESPSGRIDRHSIYPGHV